MVMVSEMDASAEQIQQLLPWPANSKLCWEPQELTWGLMWPQGKCWISHMPRRSGEQAGNFLTTMFSRRYSNIVKPQMFHPTVCGLGRLLIRSGWRVQHCMLFSHFPWWPLGEAGRSSSYSASPKLPLPEGPKTLAALSQWLLRHLLSHPLTAPAWITITLNFVLHFSKRNFKKSFLKRPAVITAVYEKISNFHSVLWSAKHLWLSSSYSLPRNGMVLSVQYPLPLRAREYCTDS